MSECENKSWRKVSLYICTELQQRNVT
jgi:hypothetical protein